METFSCFNQTEARQRANGLLCRFLEKTKTSGTPLLLLLSGGSSFTLLWGIDRSLLGPHVTISTLDERYSKDVKVNNFAQLQQAEFYAEAIVAGSSYIDTCVQEGETLERLATRFEAELKEWRRKNKQGFVFATMGIGKDGHTAGIMPFPENPKRFTELFENERRWVASYDAGGKSFHPFRVTVNTTFLRNEVSTALVFAGGSEKENALRRVFFGEGTSAETPARILREMKEVTLFYWETG